MIQKEKTKVYWVKVLNQMGEGKASEIAAFRAMDLFDFYRLYIKKFMTDGKN